MKEIYYQKLNIKIYDDTETLIDIDYKNFNEINTHKDFQKLNIVQGVWKLFKHNDKISFVLENHSSSEIPEDAKIIQKFIVIKTLPEHLIYTKRRVRQYFCEYLLIKMIMTSQKYLTLEEKKEWASKLIILGELGSIYPIESLNLMKDLEETNFFPKIKNILSKYQYDSIFDSKEVDNTFKTWNNFIYAINHSENLNNDSELKQEFVETVWEILEKNDIFEYLKHYLHHKEQALFTNPNFLNGKPHLTKSGELWASIYSLRPWFTYFSRIKINYMKFFLDEISILPNIYSLNEFKNWNHEWIVNNFWEFLKIREDSYGNHEELEMVSSDVFKKILDMIGTEKIKNVIFDLTQNQEHPHIANFAEKMLELESEVHSYIQFEGFVNWDPEELQRVDEGKSDKTKFVEYKQQ